jgi:hypothetical protein
MISETVMVVPPSLLRKIENRLICPIPEVGIREHGFPCIKLSIMLLLFVRNVDIFSRTVLNGSRLLFMRCSVRISVKLPANLR